MGNSNLVCPYETTLLGPHLVHLFGWKYVRPVTKLYPIWINGYKSQANTLAPGKVGGFDNRCGRHDMVVPDSFFISLTDPLDRQPVNYQLVLYSVEKSIHKNDQSRNTQVFLNAKKNSNYFGTVFSAKTFSQLSVLFWPFWKMTDS